MFQNNPEIFNKKSIFNKNTNINFIQLINLVLIWRRQYCSVLKKVETKLNKKKHI